MSDKNQILEPSIAQAKRLISKCINKYIHRLYPLSTDEIKERKLTPQQVAKRIKYASMVYNNYLKLLNILPISDRSFMPKLPIEYDDPDEFKTYFNKFYDERDIYLNKFMRLLSKLFFDAYVISIEKIRDTFIIKVYPKSWISKEQLRDLLEIDMDGIYQGMVSWSGHYYFTKAENNSIIIGGGVVLDTVILDTVINEGKYRTPICDRCGLIKPICVVCGMGDKYMSKHKYVSKNTNMSKDKHVILLCTDEACKKTMGYYYISEDNEDKQDEISGLCLPYRCNHW
jgi:hypothetical protein